MKINITLNSELLNNNDSDFFHYGCSYELAKCELGTWYITRRGELNIEYTDNENNISTRNYDDIIRYYVRNSQEFVKATTENKLIFFESNWFAIEFIDNNNRYIANQYYELGDNVYGSITECFYQFVADMINNKDEIMKEIQQSGANSTY